MKLKMEQQMKLSFCCVVRDKLENVKTLINSIRDIVDEIVIIDTGSDEETKAFERGCTSKVFNLAWNNDFSYMRNLAIKKSSGEWILSLDSDETISPALKNKIRSLIDGGKDLEGYRFNRVHYFDEEKPFVDHWKHLRLYRRSACYFGAIHESIKNLKKVKIINDPDCYIEHHNTRKGEREKLKIYDAEIIQKIEESKKQGDKELEDFYLYKKWVQDNIYILETDPVIDFNKLNKGYIEYEIKKKKYDDLMAKRYLLKGERDGN